MELCAKIKGAVEGWRNESYKGASVITRRLLDFWFLEDHVRRDGNEFEFLQPLVCCRRPRNKDKR